MYWQQPQPRVGGGKLYRKKIFFSFFMFSAHRVRRALLEIFTCGRRRAPYTMRAYMLICTHLRRTRVKLEHFSLSLSAAFQHFCMTKTFAMYGEMVYTRRWWWSEVETCVDILNGKIYKGIAYMGEWGGWVASGVVVYVRCKARRMEIEGEWRILRGWLEDIWMRVMVWEKYTWRSSRWEFKVCVHTPTLIYMRWNMKTFLLVMLVRGFWGIFRMPRSCYHYESCAGWRTRI